MGIDLAQKLLDVIGDEAAFFTLSEEKLRAITGGRSTVYKQSYRDELLRKAEREIEFIKEKHIKTYYFTDDNYPTRLANAADSPTLLYECGDCDLNASRLVSIVGTRRATKLGVKFCETLIAELAEQVPGTVIVSGLALGIDISAHRAAMRYGLPTVAVLAHGLNKIYPDQHRSDASQIVHHGGAIVSDYTSQDELHRGNFLARNRIIAALSDATIVIESDIKGGSLVTANIANSYNREVFAVPGRVGDRFSSGCNKLIQSNQAALITSASDVVKALGWEASSPRQDKQLELFPELTAEEQMVVDALRENGDMHINEITTKLNIPVYQVMGLLVDLDCRGIVTALPGSRYALV